MAGGEQLLAGACRAALPFAGEVVRLAGAGAAVRASTPTGPGDAPVPGAWSFMDGEENGVDAAGRAPGDAVVAEGAVHRSVLRARSPVVTVMWVLSEKVEGERASVGPSR